MALLTGISALAGTSEVSKELDFSLTYKFEDNTVTSLS